MIHTYVLMLAAVVTSGDLSDSPTSSGLSNEAAAGSLTGRWVVEVTTPDQYDVFHHEMQDLFGFLVFFTQDGNERRGGTGLGLNFGPLLLLFDSFGTMYLGIGGDDRYMGAVLNYRDENGSFETRLVGR